VVGIVEEVRNKKQSKKTPEFYEQQQQKLEQEIYSDMASFRGNVLGGAQESRAFAFQFQQNLRKRMRADHDLIDQIVIPSLFHYFRPPEISKQPRMTVEVSK
jgi:hypothetical protein